MQLVRGPELHGPVSGRTGAARAPFERVVPGMATPFRVV